MEKKKLSSDAHQWMYDRYIKDDPEAHTSLKEIKIQADLAGQIYGIRTRLHMTRGELAEFSSLTPEAIEDLEESDYDGDWDEAIKKVNTGFHDWFTNVILPAAGMKPEEYSVGITAG